MSEREREEMMDPVERLERLSINYYIEDINLTIIIGSPEAIHISFMHARVFPDPHGYSYPLCGYS